MTNANATATETTTLATRIEVVCKPFRHYPRGSYRVAVEADGSVLVFDSIARHYTHCHSLSRRSQARIRSLGRAVRVASIEAVRS